MEYCDSLHYNAADKNRVVGILLDQLASQERVYFRHKDCPSAEIPAQVTGCVPWSVLFAKGEDDWLTRHRVMSTGHPFVRECMYFSGLCWVSEVKIFTVCDLQICAT